LKTKSISLNYIVSSVPSYVRERAAAPDDLRSEISFSRTGNITNLISQLYCIALVTLNWLCVYMIAKLHAHQNKYLLSVNFLRGNTDRPSFQISIKFQISKNASTTAPLEAKNRHGHYV